MITLEQLKEFAQYNGDIDHWSKMRGKILLTERDWHLIDGFIQDIFLCKNRLASKYFTAELERRLQETFQDGESLEYLKSMVK